MIVLDTNVISETMRSEPDANVMRWLNAQHLDALWLTAITVTELRFGAARCLLYTSPSPRDRQKSRMPSSA